VLATVVEQRSVLQPHLRRVTPLRRPMKVATYHRRARPCDGRHVLAFVNGEPLLRADWSRRVIRDGDVVAFVHLPLGGGGSNPLRVVALLAVVALAPYAAGAIAPSLGIASGGFAFGVLKAGIALAGAALVNAVLPAPKPPTPQLARDLAAPSPTYTLGAQGNTARLGSPIPVQYGRHLAYPDFAAQPYTEFVGNEQYLYQLMVVGAGSYSIESKRIEDTSLDSFEDVQDEVVAPGGAVTLFPANVVTSVEVASQEALTSTTLGPFVANAAGTRVNALAVDVVAPRGLYYAADDGSITAKTIAFTVEAQEIDDSGTPVGGWVTLGSESISAATTTPQRRSFRYTLTSGRYQARLTRTDTKDTSTRAGHELNWFGLRAYLPDTTSYGNVTLWAVRIRASNQLSGLSGRRFNLICTRQLPSRLSGQWQAANATTNPAWAAADLCRNTDYGLGLSDTQYDLAQLEQLAVTWATRGDQFNARFDSAVGAWEALTQILRAGRAAPSVQGGVIRFVRHQAGTLPTAVYSMRNIVPGSFSLRYQLVTEETTDGVEMRYFDDTVWTERPVTAVLAGQSGVNLAKVQGYGITQRAQAFREAAYSAAQNRWMRTFATFQTELEGHLSTYGDLVAVQHDMPAWHQHGEAVQWRAPELTLRSSEPFAWGSGTHWAALRGRRGEFFGPYRVTRGADDRDLVFQVAPQTDIAVDGRGERTHIIFTEERADGSAFRLFRVVGVRPNRGRVELAVVNEDARVHIADQASVPAAPSWDLPGTPVLPVIVGELAVVEAPTSTPQSPRVAVSWPAASGAQSYLVEHAGDSVLGTPASVTVSRSGTTATVSHTAHGRSTGDYVLIEGADQGAYNGTKRIAVVDADSYTFYVGGLPATPATGTITAALVTPAWTRVADTTQTQAQFSVPAGVNYIRVAPLGQGRGPWVAWSGTVSGLTATPATPATITNLTATAGVTSIILEWDEVTDAQVDRIEIWRHTANDINAAQFLDAVVGEQFLYADKLGSAGLTRYYWVRPVNRKGVAGAFTGAASATTGQAQTGDIADGAVDTVKIADAAIVTAKIANANVTTAKIADANITTAKIADAQITTAKIVDANVSTLKIAGNAATLPITSYTDGLVVPPLGIGVVATATITVPSDAAAQPVIVQFSVTCDDNATGGGQMGFSCRRNTVQILPTGITYFTVEVPSGGRQQLAVAFADTPGAGTWTYDLYQAGIGSGKAVRQRSTVLLLAKR
jgi:sulfur carrier protein ThiS